MRANKRLQFLLEVKKLHGTRVMLATLWSGLRNLGGTRLILVALTEPRKIEKALNASQGHDFHFASPEELRVLQKDADNQIDDIDVHRVEQGIAQCMVQMDGEKLTGYAWVWNSKIAYIHDGVYINLPVDTIYNYKAYTVPEYRGLAFQGLRHINLLKLLKKDGVVRLFGFVDHMNTRSLHGVKKSGYIKVGELRIKHQKGRVKSVLNLEQHFWTGNPAPSELE